MYGNKFKYYADSKFTTTTASEQLISEICMDFSQFPIYGYECRINIHE